MTTPHHLATIHALDDLAPLARKFLPRALWEFASMGAEENLSRNGNRAAFGEVWFKPRVLQDVTGRSIEQELFGHRYAAPFGIAPMGASAMFGFEADLAFARSAAAADIPFMMSGSAVMPMEKIVAANPDIWFQAYVDADREAIKTLAARAWAAGIRTFAVTVDVPVPGNRRDSLRAGFEYPMRPSARLAWDGITHPRWLVAVLLRTLLENGMPHIENYGSGRGIPMISATAPQRKHVRDALDWDDLQWLRDEWQGRLLVKGVLSAEDAATAAAIGLDGLVVSNHGGRQLDGALPPLRALPDIVAAKGDLTILLDGGIRRGTDVLKALALGADFVFVGRPFLYAASLFADAGIARVIELLSAEIDRDLALLGCTKFAELPARIVAPRA